MADVESLLVEAVGAPHVLAGATASADYFHDEALTGEPRVPAYVVRPGSTAEVAAVLRIADELRVPVTARGSGTGLSGGAIPATDGILLSVERMDAVLEVDTANAVAVVQPGVTLAGLDAATEESGLHYPVGPGEDSASLGGTVATNAGGMRAVKYGVTRHQVLGVEAVLASGDVIRTGGKFVKVSTGYDLTQLIVGSEGTLAVVTEAILRLYPRTASQATVLVPFPTLDEVASAVPLIVGSGLEPLILEYIDLVTMAAITTNADLDLGVPAAVRDRALAYLVVVLDSTTEDRLDADVATLGELLAEHGALDVYVLPAQAGRRLIDAREKAFWAAKAAGADDVLDIVVPRAAIPAFLARVGEVAEQHASLVVGCGHAGDGNVHLSVFQPDPQRRQTLTRELFQAGMALGGAISGEHGIGESKRSYFLELEDPAKVALMRRVKQAFDPHGILNPGVLLGFVKGPA